MDIPNLRRLNNSDKEYPYLFVRDESFFYEQI